MTFSDFLALVRLIVEEIYSKNSTVVKIRFSNFEIAKNRKITVKIFLNQLISYGLLREPIIALLLHKILITR